MREIRTKQQLLLELMKIQNELKKKVKIQDNMVKKFQMLTEMDELFAQIISHFPYPLAVFTPQGTLTMANQELIEYANLNLKDVEDGKCNIVQIDKLNNLRLSSECKKVFNGETLLLDDLKKELPSTFIDKNDETLIKTFNKAVLFPVAKGDGTITHGVVVLMNQSSSAHKNEGGK